LRDEARNILALGYRVNFSNAWRIRQFVDAGKAGTLKYEFTVYHGNIRREQIRGCVEPTSCKRFQIVEICRHPKLD
jgi:hypothetical protein